jgi:hypothetical protein
MFKLCTWCLLQEDCEISGKTKRATLVISRWNNNKEIMSMDYLIKDTLRHLEYSTFFQHFNIVLTIVTLQST